MVNHFWALRREGGPTRPLEMGETVMKRLICRWVEQWMNADDLGAIITKSWDVAMQPENVDQEDDAASSGSEVCLSDIEVSDNEHDDVYLDEAEEPAAADAASEHEDPGQAEDDGSAEEAAEAGAPSLTEDQLRRDEALARALAFGRFTRSTHNALTQ